jgi:putative transposase
VKLTASAKGMVESPGKNLRQKTALNREILEASPGMMISMPRDKAEGAGGWFAVIDARNTSQQCSQCGRTVPKDRRSLSERCAHCENQGPTRLKRAVARPWSGFARPNNGLA